MIYCPSLVRTPFSVLDNTRWVKSAGHILKFSLKKEVIGVEECSLDGNASHIPKFHLSKFKNLT